MTVVEISIKMTLPTTKLKNLINKTKFSLHLNILQRFKKDGITGYFSFVMLSAPNTSPVIT